MLPTEAIWIGEVLRHLSAERISPCLNLGSSTEHFRNFVQPYIHQYIVLPNEKRGVTFVHADVKSAVGVDVVGDILDQDFQERLATISPRSVLCCNMLEHVEDKGILAEVCTRVVQPNGYIIVSVPKSFPYHLDPIDTYYRPRPEEIAALFPHCRLTRSEIVIDKTYMGELWEQGFFPSMKTICKTLAHAPIPFYKWDRWKCKMHQLFWLFRRYRVSIAVLQKDAKPHLPMAAFRDRTV